MTPSRLVLLYGALACVFAALSVIVYVLAAEHLAGVMAGIVAASCAFEASLFWRKRPRTK